MTGAGLEGIVAGQTAVCSIAGKLIYRGYSIDELSVGADFEEVGYLLLHGELPSYDQLGEFRERLGAAYVLPEPVVELLTKLPATTPFMDVMRTACSVLAHYDADVNDDSRAAEMRKSERLVAQLAIVLATAYRLRTGRAPAAADPDAGIAENLLTLIHDRKPDLRAVRALNVSLILYAEHEFNASTFTARTVASTLADLHSAITAAIGALKGPLHGGANERVLEVLEQVGAPANAEPWIRDALANKKRVMGFGHRVYKDGDPRTKILDPWCAELAESTGNQAMEQVAATLERVVRAEKKLPPNADWPSARLYYYLGLPVETYTPLFVVARTTGWCAHVMEQHGDNRLVRPMAEYIGPPERPFVPLERRS
jgi:2-methylcitrate synthase/citrate synthase II